MNLKLFKESNCQGIDFNIKAYEEKLAKNIFNEKQAKEVKSALEDIKKVNHLMYVTAWLSEIVMILLLVGSYIIVN